MRPCRTKLALRLAVVAALALAAQGPAPARAATRLRVMTYNIHVGIGMDKKLDLERVAREIRAERPDLVALQEVDRGVRRTRGLDEIAELARLTRMEYAFAPNLDYQGGKYGVAILSRLPILSLDHRRFANRREAERRGMLRVEVLAGGRRVNFVTTHLDYQYSDGRLFETEQLLEALEGVRGPLIVTGDFNDEPAGSSYRLMLSRFTDAWGEAGEGTGPGLTYPADKPSKRIDYVFAGPGVRVRKAFVRQTLASDHLPLVVDLEL